MLTEHRTFPRVAGTTGIVLVLLALAAQPLAAQAAEAEAALQTLGQGDTTVTDVYEELGAALIRLPLAALLGTALALRPRRAGTPERSMPVIETQVVLAIVGALIMLVIGASLARAFGIVGAANLIRYRAKIDDPKDAVVMLSTLAIGLASGVGLYALAVFGTLFVGLTLWAIESFEPEMRKPFELSVKLEHHARQVRPDVERVLRNFQVTYELRGSSEDEITYWTTAPKSVRLDKVSNALQKLRKEEDLAVEWAEKKPTKSA